MRRSFFRLILITVFLSPLSLPAVEAPREVTNREVTNREVAYRGGQDVCKHSQSQRQGEWPLWIQVPVDYQRPERGRFPLYAWTKSPWDPTKKTMIYFAGGPGDSSHASSMTLMDWNVVFFDQRGVACSRPPTLELYQDPSFYSSLNTVRDVEEIRRSLGVEKVSVYGVSYGTIPAHLYGALFRAHTRAVVLEGVIFHSEAQTLIENPQRRKILQHFFDRLPQAHQDRILEISQNPAYSPGWYSNVGRMMLFVDQPLEAFRRFLDQVLWSESLLKTLLPNFEMRRAPEVEFGPSSMTLRMLSCKELGMNTPGASFSAVFQGRQLVAERNSRLREMNCAPLGFQAQEPNQGFLAETLPLWVPVTYFQGTLDGSTAASEAVKSYKKATQGPAQLVLVKNGGHMPLQGPLASGYETGPALVLRQKILSEALAGLPLSQEVLSGLSNQTRMEWLLLQRNTKRKSVSFRGILRGEVTNESKSKM